MFGFFQPKIGSYRGKSRIQIENRALANAGFTAGSLFVRTIDLARREIVLTLDSRGTHKVHSREISGDRVPKVDVITADIAAMFPQCDNARVRVYEGRIVIDLCQADRRRVGALERFKRALTAGRISKGGLFTGGGVSERALTEGLESEGLLVSHDFVFERDMNNLAVAQKNSPAISTQTKVTVADINDYEPDMVSQVDLLSVSMPCVGHCNAGRAKNKISRAEDHADAGHVVLGTLRAIEDSQASVVVFENSEKFDTSITADMVEKRMVRLGYTVHKFRLNETHCGTIERRVRSIWIAELGILNGEQLRAALETKVVNHRTVSDIIDADHGEQWRTFDGLLRKMARDVEKGNGFLMQPVSASASQYGTVGAGYARIRSTEPKILHAEDSAMMRQLSAVEHARGKGVPENHIRGVSKTRAHTILGNSVLYPLFVKIAKAIVASIDMPGASTPPARSLPRQDALVLA